MFNDSTISPQQFAMLRHSQMSNSPLGCKTALPNNSS